MPKIVFNLCPAPEEEDKNLVMQEDVAEVEPLRARAILAFVGAVFSDGTECTEEVARQLVDSVDLALYAPPLLVDHDWQTRSIIGTMESIELTEDGRIVAGFVVRDAEAITKIKDGSWRSVSVTFEAPGYSIQECSVVAVPAIQGAKIEPATEIENADDEDDETIDEAELAREELLDARAEDAPAEDMPAEGEGDDEDKKELVSERKRVANAAKKISVLNAKIARLKRENATLKAEKEESVRTAEARRAVDSWVKNGLTSPAMAGAEMAFCRRLMQTGAGLYEDYKSIKRMSAGCSAPSHVGRRLSVANAAPTMSEVERIKKEQREYMEARAERRKNGK